MKYSDLPGDTLTAIENDVLRYRREYEWEYGIIGKVLRRNYDTDITSSQIIKIARKLGIYEKRL